MTFDLSTKSESGGFDGQINVCFTFLVAARRTPPQGRETTQRSGPATKRSRKDTGSGPPKGQTGGDRSRVAIPGPQQRVGQKWQIWTLGGHSPPNLRARQSGRSQAAMPGTWRRDTLVTARSRSQAAKRLKPLGARMLGCIRQQCLMLSEGFEPAMAHSQRWAAARHQPLSGKAGRLACARVNSLLDCVGRSTGPPDSHDAGKPAARQRPLLSLPVSQRARGPSACVLAGSVLPRSRGRCRRS